MGTWGSSTFDNDMAEDWLDMFLEDPTKNHLAETFEEFREDGHEDADQCCVALAAAEVIAGLTGKPAGELPEELTEWLSAKTFKPSATLVKQAGSAVAKIRKTSELAELWSEDDEWLASVEDLLRRLGRKPKPLHAPKKKQPFRISGLQKPLKNMTGLAGFAFAVRCVMRVYPLILQSDILPAVKNGKLIGKQKRVRDILKRLIDITSGKKPLTQENIESSGKGTNDEFLFECIEIIWEAKFNNQKLAAESFCDAMRYLSGCANVLLKHGIVDEHPRHVANSTKVAAEFARKSKPMKFMAADFRYLEEHHSLPKGKKRDLGVGIDVSESGPMGLLWGDAPPMWFRECDFPLD